jgi:hypothetical protein
VRRCSVVFDRFFGVCFIEERAEKRDAKGGKQKQFGGEFIGGPRHSGDGKEVEEARPGNQERQREKQFGDEETPMGNGDI